MQSHPRPISMDYAALRQEGLRQLERLSGGQWTDFNTHDPGITLLEQVCYALTDLGYRTAHDIPDLLAEGGRDPYESLHPPAKILTCRPVTPADLRRVVLDVRGVENAWVEPLLGADAPTLYHDPTDRSLGLKAGSLLSEPVSLKGLYRVLVDPADDAGDDLVARVAARLHENRGLCEDFSEILRLKQQDIQVEATVEIGTVDDAGRLVREILRKIADVISPPVQWRTLGEMLGAGMSLDAIFDGPRLDRGFLPDEALEQATRQTAIHTSDLVRAVRDVAGVRAVSAVHVRDISVPAGGWERWSLGVPKDEIARLDHASSTITLKRAGKVVARIKGQEPAPTSRRAAAGEGGLSLPAGRDRHVGQYTTVARHLPAVYGVGDLGLSASAPPERRARAKQLRAYLMFFDQIMANHLAQLAHVPDLFSHDGGELTTYFAGPVTPPGAPEMTGAHRGEQKTLTKSLAARHPDGGASAVDVERKNRFLSHLLARFAEALDDHGISSAAALAHRKQEYLRQYPRLGGARGTAFNYLQPAGRGNLSGLEQRIRLQLGLTAEERPIVVEHILLRPMEEDDRPTEEDDAEEVPLLSAALCKDPYSMQLTFVFNADAGRFATGSKGWSDFRALAEQAVREETPAHLAVYVRWMEGAGSTGWDAFDAAHREWLERRREAWAEKLGVRLEKDA